MFDHAQTLSLAKRLNNLPAPGQMASEIPMRQFLLSTVFALVAASLATAEDPKPIPTPAELKRQIAELKALNVKRKAEIAKIEAEMKKVDAEKEKVKAVGAEKVKVAIEDGRKVLIPAADALKEASRVYQEAVKAETVVGTVFESVIAELKQTDDPERIAELVKTLAAIKVLALEKRAATNAAYAEQKKAEADYREVSYATNAQVKKVISEVEQAKQPYIKELAKLRRVIDELEDEIGQNERLIKRLQDQFTNDGK